MEWNVVNAVNRDVERQHLNKILKEIKGSYDSISSQVNGNAQQIENVSTVITRVVNEQLTPAQLATRVELTGDVTGVSVPVPGQNAVTITTTLQGAYVQEAPIDSQAYWRFQGAWQAVPAAVQNMTTLDSTGYVVLDGNGFWRTRDLLTADTSRIVITDGSGSVGDTTFDLAAVADSGTGALLAVARDAYGRMTGTKAATITGTAGQITVVNGNAVAGLPTISLSDVTDSGTGTLLATTFDSKGRKTGSKAATITGTTNQIVVTNGDASAGLPTLSLASAVTTALARVPPAGGTTGQFLRGDNAWSNEIQGPVRVVANVNAPGMVAGLFGVYSAAPDGTPAFAHYDAFGQSTGLIFRRSNNTAASPTALAAAELIGQFQGRGHDGTSYAANESVSIRYEADGNWTNTSHPGRIAFATTPVGAVTFTRRVVINGDGTVTPGADNTQSFGVGGLRWSVIYAGTGAINTSDAREKTPVRDLNKAELDAAIALGKEVGAYKWLASVEEKGEGARWHIGMTVQRAMEVMSAHGLDPFAYGFICHDSWEASPEVWDLLPEELDEEGNVVKEASKVLAQEAREAGDMYSFRPDGLHAFILKGMLERQNSIEARLLALENK